MTKNDIVMSDIDIHVFLVEVNIPPKTCAISVYLYYCTVVGRRSSNTCKKAKYVDAKSI